MLDRTLKAEIKKFLGTGIAREDRVAVNTRIREVAEEMASISRFDKDPLPEYLRRHGRAAVAVCIACTLYERRSRLGNWGVNWAMEVLGLWRWRDADGSSGDHFYYSMFGGSGGASMIRSLAGQTRSGSLTMQQEMDGAKVNGALWNIHTWSRRQLIRDLCVLMGKSTETQAVFGNGNCRSATSASGILATGTLKNMGQFYGYNNATNQVKVFHIEAFWGDMWDRIAGILVNNYEVWAKMTPEGDGYQVSSLTGYTDTGIAVPASMSQSYLSAHATNRYGSFPTGASGSGSTFYCDGAWSASGLMCLHVGASASNASALGGGFSWVSTDAPSNASWIIGCGLSCDEPVAAA